MAPLASFYTPLLRSKWLQGILCASLVVSAMAEDERASNVAVAIAATLMGAISFQMSLFYLLNHKDQDMRRYTNEVISSTISIFCAVLMFSEINDNVELYISGGTSLEFQTFIGFCHMFVWFGILQFSLAYISGAIGGAPDSLKDMELNMKCWATLFAHMTGFAAINAWGLAQQLPFFSQSPFYAFLTVPMGLAFLLALAKMTDTIRYRISHGDDGEEDEFEEAWDEETEEAENDVMGLTLSFLMTQTLRFGIGGILPNEEGEEEVSTKHNHTTEQCVLLFGMAIVFIAVLVGMIMKKGSTELEGSAERNFGMTTAVVSMSMAWCVFFSVRWYLNTYPVFMSDPMLLNICLALLLSLCCFSVIFVLDKIADADWTGDAADDAIRQIIGGIGILVGFAWEQCFDVAVASMASVSPDPHLAKAVLAVFCVGIIVPAWRWYLLPMVVNGGWKCGFVPKAKVVSEALQHYKTQEKEHTEKAVELGLKDESHVHEMEEKIGKLEKKLNKLTHLHDKHKQVKDAYKAKNAASDADPTPPKKEAPAKKETKKEATKSKELKEPLLNQKSNLDASLIGEDVKAYIDDTLNPVLLQFVDRCLTKRPANPLKEMEQFVKDNEKGLN